ncbi:uncharacterized protein LOC133175630 [Saccostrea echinata]|uniref:uncharacterized protein LOC133175630 n=1 Tax=Saccostrea echinata TaxID=191078 RepID=UPI002A80DF95|nr:uncharacterized protein LOC133175630 [Saccostrea echinata]
MLQQLQWQTLKQRRDTTRLVMLYSIVYHLVDIPADQHLQRTSLWKEATLCGSLYQGPQFTTLHSSPKQQCFGTSCQVSIWCPGMWPDKFCLHYACYVIMILSCVVSLHAHRTRSNGLNIDNMNNVLQIQRRSLANHRLQTFNDLRQVLQKMENIYSSTDKHSILRSQVRDKRDAVGFAGSDILDTLLSTLLRPDQSGRAPTSRPRGRLSVQASFAILRNRMQNEG